LHSTKQEAGADAAAGYLNEIRRRSPGLAPATAATITDDMILDERSKELLRELGAEDTLAFEEAAMDSYRKRVAEFMEPGRGWKY
jgi:hypothetical protein